MDIYTAIKLMAMKAVIEPDEAAVTRRIQRWYSKTFFTPLSEVEKIDFFEILTHYYEETYEAANSSGSEQEGPVSKVLLEEYEELTMTPEEAQEKALEKEREDFEAYVMLKAIKEQEAKREAEFKKKQAEAEKTNKIQEEEAVKKEQELVSQMTKDFMNFEGLEGEENQ